MDLAAPHPLPLGRSRDWPRLVRDGTLLGFFGHGYFSVFGALLDELFPTRLRATAQGFCYNIGRALSALAPMTVGALAQAHGLGPALLITSAFFLVAAVLVSFLPETKGTVL